MVNHGRPWMTMVNHFGDGQPWSTIKNRGDHGQPWSSFRLGSTGLNGLVCVDDTDYRFHNDYKPVIYTPYSKTWVYRGTLFSYFGSKA